MEKKWLKAYKASELFDFPKGNGLILFALGLKFNLEDLYNIGVNSITDAPNDKKCDLVYVNKEDGFAVIAQCYVATDASKDKAKSNKASDLNTAIAWLFNRELEDLPKDSPSIPLYSVAKELRDAIENNEINTIYFWYVHNLKESNHVKDELISVKKSASLISSIKNKNINIIVDEIGSETLEDWYKSNVAPILVTDAVDIPIDGGYTIKGDFWESFATSISIDFLYEIFKKHKENLFSANIRGYLGSRATDSNINHGIKNTLEDKKNSKNFWVFNNGITIITNDFKVSDNKLSVSGISIVNGAQTTGAIGSLKTKPNNDIKVHARFIKVESGNEALVQNIIQYNNSQNKINASDFRSTDRIQKKLRQEFESIPDAEYEGGRRGGASSIISRKVNLLPSLTVGQALACFNQDPIIAYNQKSNIWLKDNLYAKYFNESITAKHVVFCYSLYDAILDTKKKYLIKESDKLTEDERKEFDFFKTRGAIPLFCSAIAACLEVILNKKISNTFGVYFKENLSPNKAKEEWIKIIDRVLPLCIELDGALHDGLKNIEEVKKAIEKFRALVKSTAKSNSNIYQDFANKVHIE